MLLKFAALFPALITCIFVFATAIRERKALPSVTAFAFLGTISMLGLSTLASLAMTAFGAATGILPFVFASGEGPTIAEIQRGLAIQNLIAASLLLIFGKPLLRWLQQLLKKA